MTRQHDLCQNLTALATFAADVVGCRRPARAGRKATVAVVLRLADALDAVGRVAAALATAAAIVAVVFAAIAGLLLALARETGLGEDVRRLAVAAGRGAVRTFSRILAAYVGVAERMMEGRTPRRTDAGPVLLAMPAARTVRVAA